MNSQLQIFENPEFGKIRTILINGEIYFVGKDVATALGYANTRKAIIDHVDEEDKKDGVTIRDAIGREQFATVINESGLYSLILSSNLPKAKEFKHWVTSDVLPKIRQFGVYATADFAKQAIKNPKWAINILQELSDEQEKNARLTEENSVLCQQINELTPKASYYDVVLNCRDLVAISTIAKDYGFSAKKLNNFLHDWKIQYRQGDIWLLYQKYAGLGWTQTKTQIILGSDGRNHTVTHTYWTQKGRYGLYEILKQHGYLPKIEQN